MRFRPTTSRNARLRFPLIVDAARRGFCFLCLGVPPGEVTRAKRILRIVRAAREN